MSLSQYKHLFKAFYFGLLTISLLFSAVLLDAIARNLRARPFSEKNTKTRTDPFFASLFWCGLPHKRSKWRVFSYFIIFWGYGGVHDKLAQKDSVAILSL